MLLFALPELLQGILAHTLSREESFDVVAHRDLLQALPDVARQNLVDVVITSNLALRQDPMLIDLVHDNPRIKIFNVTREGRQTCLCELHPECRNLGQLTPQDFAEQIREVVEIPFRFWAALSNPEAAP